MFLLLFLLLILHLLLHLLLLLPLNLSKIIIFFYFDHFCYCCPTAVYPMLHPCCTPPPGRGLKLYCPTGCPCPTPVVPVLQARAACGPAYLNTSIGEREGTNMFSGHWFPMVSPRIKYRAFMYTTLQYSLVQCYACTHSVLCPKDQYRVSTGDWI